MNDRLFGFDIEKRWDYENGFYITSETGRIGKMLAHYELYRSIVPIPGQVVECGVFKGASLIRFATFREMLESQFSRKIIGFDAFGKFPRPEHDHDQEFVENFERTAGEGISEEELYAVLDYKKIENVELVQGNLLETLPDYCEEHPELKIALLHVDVDVYDATAAVLRYLFKRVVRGGLVVFDDFATIYGETKAIDEFFVETDYQIQKFPYTPTPAYIRK